MAVTLENVGRAVPPARWPLMLAIGLATGLDFLENSMVVLSSAHIRGGVGASPEEFVWVTAAYAVASVLVILNQGQLAARFGYRRYLIFSLLLAVAGSVACGGARSVGALVLGRGVQGLGGGALFTSSRVLLQIRFEGPARAAALRWFGIVPFGCLVLAPLLAGLILQDLEWYWVFYAPIPLTLACAGLFYFGLPAGGEAVRRERAGEDAERRAETRRGFDYWPVALFSVGLLAAQFVLLRLQFQFLGQSPALVLLLLVAAAAFAAFLVHQVRAREPLLHLRGLHVSLPLRWGIAFYGVNYLLTYAFSYLFPVYSEQGLGFSVEQTGLLLCWGSLFSFGAMLGVVFGGGRVRDKRWLMCPALACLAAGAWWLSRLSPGVPVGGLYGPLALYGMFGALLILPVAGLTFQELDPEFFGHGYRLKNIVRQLCSTAAVGAMTAGLQHREQTHRFDLAPHLSLSDPAFTARLSQTARLMVGGGLSPPDARAAALALLARAAERQALLLSCLDAFAALALLAALACLVMLCQRRLR